MSRSQCIWQSRKLHRKLEAFESSRDSRSRVHRDVLSCSAMCAASFSLSTQHCWRASARAVAVLWQNKNKDTRKKKETHVLDVFQEFARKKSRQVGGPSKRLRYFSSSRNGSPKKRRLGRGEARLFRARHGVPLPAPAPKMALNSGQPPNN